MSQYRQFLLLIVCTCEAIKIHHQCINSLIWQCHLLVNQDAQKHTANCRKGQLCNLHHRYCGRYWWQVATLQDTCNDHRLTQGTLLIRDKWKQESFEESDRLEQCLANRIVQGRVKFVLLSKLFMYNRKQYCRIKALCHSFIQVGSKDSCGLVCGMWGSLIGFGKHNKLLPIFYVRQYLKRLGHLTRGVLLHHTANSRVYSCYSVINNSVVIVLLPFIVDERCLST